MSDVLAVAAGGMLVRASLWNTLEGFDPSLPAIDDALDFCVRARLAGHRVQLVPAARVRSASRWRDEALGSMGREMYTGVYLRRELVYVQ